MADRAADRVRHRDRGLRIHGARGLPPRPRAACRLRSTNEHVVRLRRVFAALLRGHVGHDALVERAQLGAEAPLERRIVTVREQRGRQLGSRRARDGGSVGAGDGRVRGPAEERQQVREREKRLAAIVHHAWNANGTLPWPLLRQHLAAVVRGLRRRSASPRRAEGEIGVAAGVFGAVAPRAGSDVHFIDSRLRAISFVIF